MSKLNNSPAFPTGSQQEWGPDAGMSLRDWFASQAAGHALAYARRQIDKYGDKSCADHTSAAAELCYRFADAMLAVRQKDQAS